MIKLRLLPTFITLICVPVLLGLGAWQVQRLHWKRELIATIGERVQQAPVDVSFLDGMYDADYRPAKAEGVFQNDKEIFIIATSLTTGEGGYHVVTPLLLDSGAYLFVDRGWIPFERKDKQFSLPQGRVEIDGILRVPSKPSWLQPKNDPDEGNWYNIDLPAMAATDQLGQFLPFVLDAGSSDQDDQYPIGGQTRLTLPNDHFSYAVTWFSLAIVVVIIYFLSCRIKPED